MAIGYLIHTLLGRLFGMLRRLGRSGEPDDGWFRIRVNGRTLRFDSMQALRRLRRDPEFSIHDDPPRMDAGDEEAILRAVGAVRRVFELPSNEHGVSDEQALAIFVKFAGHVERRVAQAIEQNSTFAVAAWSGLLSKPSAEQKELDQFTAEIDRRNEEYQRTAAAS